jgi:putative NADPH-quinone reductase
MKKILALNGSPRPSGNTGFLLNRFLEGAVESNAEVEMIRAQDLNLDYCSGCLRCNILKRCSLRGDDWESLSQKIRESDILVFASPVYFHHLTASLKKVLDRFRSFTHVQITETGLIHTPHQIWNKDFVLLLTMGSPDPAEAQPVIDLFRFLTEMLGDGNRLHVICATRLAVSRQVIRSEEELLELYPRLGLPVSLVAEDYRSNREILDRCQALGTQIGR